MLVSGVVQVLAVPFLALSRSKGSPADVATEVVSAPQVDATPESPPTV
jgi:hypothetical protein